MTHHLRCDIAVIGGGPAGSTAAFLLASNGLDVLLIDKRHFPRPKLCAGLLTWKSIELLQSIHNLSTDDMVDLGVITHSTRNYRIYVGAAEIARGCLDFPFYFVDRMAYDHLWFNKAIQAGARGLTGVPVRRVDPERRMITLSDARAVEAKAIIGADGVWSVVRRSIFNGRIANRRWRRQLAMAIEAPARCIEKSPDRNFAALHFGFVPWGYAWSFPGRKGHLMGIAKLRNNDSHNIRNEFNTFLSSPDLKQMAVGPPKSYPLPFGNYLDPPGRGRVLLTGDACGLADPLLGEGIYYAHRSAQIAAQTLIAKGADYPALAHHYRKALNRKILRELRWIKTCRNWLYLGGRHRRFRGLKALLRIMPKRLEAAVHGQLSFSRLFWPLS